jgi:hypothetical protein
MPSHTARTQCVTSSPCVPGRHLGSFQTVTFFFFTDKAWSRCGHLQLGSYDDSPGRIPKCQKLMYVLLRTRPKLETRHRSQTLGFETPIPRIEPPPNYALHRKATGDRQILKHNMLKYMILQQYWHWNINWNAVLLQWAILQLSLCGSWRHVTHPVILDLGNGRTRMISFTPWWL